MVRRGVQAVLIGAAAVMMDYSQGGVCPSAQYQDTLAALARAIVASSVRRSAPASTASASKSGAGG